MSRESLRIPLSSGGTLCLTFEGNWMRLVGADRRLVFAIADAIQRHADETAPLHTVDWAEVIAAAHGVR